MAPQLTQISGFPRRSPPSWIARAMTSLPVPVSPRINTGRAVEESRSTVRKTSTMAGLWTTGRVSRAVPTADGGTEPFPLKGFDARNASGVGDLQLVTPITVVRLLDGADPLTSYAKLDMQFVPEPGAALLFAVGGAVLAVAGVRRR